VIRRLDLRGRTLHARDLRGVVPRAELDVEHALATVRPICDDVRERGAVAVLELTERFDGVRPEGLRVPADTLADALDVLDPQVRTALEEAIRRTRAVHPSSVVMNVVPAQEAGVASLAVTSPPQRDNPPGFEGAPHPTILAACALLGVDEVYAVGGAQAVAMFAYGARDDDGDWACEPVDLVTGPGNVYVAAAKRLLRGVVGIDAEAGPTEIAVLADDSADPVHVAADLVSQAEHDTLAAAVLVTDSPALADAVEAELARQVAATKHSERITAALAGTQSGIVLVDDVDAGLAVVDAYAAEHLEVQTRDAASVAARVRNAGAVFVGPWAPVSLGDYLAGSNHVLPTGGCACHSGGLSVQTFLRGVHVVAYDEHALAAAADHVVTLANAEDLPAHGQAVQARFPAR
jgi:histidinol dehydrogenase